MKDLNNNRFQMACNQGDMKNYKNLSELPEIDPSLDDNYCLRTACQNGHFRIVEKLLEFPGVNVECRNHEPLQVACANGHIEIIELLLKHGADISANHYFSVKRACYRGYDNILLLFLKDRTLVNKIPAETLIYAQYLASFSSKEVVDSISQHLMYMPSSCTLTLPLNSTYSISSAGVQALSASVIPASSGFQASKMDDSNLFFSGESMIQSVLPCDFSVLVILHNFTLLLEEKRPNKSKIIFSIQMNGKSSPPLPPLLPDPEASAPDLPVHQPSCLASFPAQSF